MLDNFWKRYWRGENTGRLGLELNVKDSVMGIMSIHIHTPVLLDIWYKVVERSGSEVPQGSVFGGDVDVYVGVTVGPCVLGCCLC